MSRGQGARHEPPVFNPSAQTLELFAALAKVWNDLWMSKPKPCKSCQQKADQHRETLKIIQDEIHALNVPVCLSCKRLVVGRYERKCCEACNNRMKEERNR